MEKAELDARIAMLGQMHTAMQYAVRDVDLTDEEAMKINTIYPAWGDGVAYAVGAVVNHNNNLYRCAQAHTSQADWTPDAAASLWSPISIAEDGTEMWTQPSGAHDAYAAGAVVLHGGKRWVSDIDGNVWEPGLHGWTEQPA
ncbi:MULTISPECIES: carbohydrate-binding protein [Gordonibacter]|uniref:Chitin-binding type-3 domain-containing protein n=1 Tax=Gordonibacter faecis TaxID=3047475 RepID=A0ABT7DQ04_9ACTN|nr:MULTISPECIES: carbohydrate-binding protein [unclassified Gordonibacter]MDJ1651619.1 hypothetical protein [Gordonibacter sp. KGMB12511]HIW77041.1 hypothetical protein [Candidatus Gordonibacter avicola]